MITYLIIALLLILTILVYFRIADRFSIIDKPNERSSHSYITIRGGGVIFPVAALLWFTFYGFHQVWAIAGLILVAIISFTDDLNPLPGSVRMPVQFVAVILLMAELEAQHLPWYYAVIAIILAVYWINAFNFMDGINAITPFYSMAALATFLVLNQFYPFFDEGLIVVLIISAVMFSYFNARKRARTFAGDVGSISMAFLLVWMLLTLILETGRYEYILLFSVYGLDSAFTIFFRLLRHENIFKAHRSHLYQLLSNEMKWPHIKVSILYAVAQLVINLLVVYLILNDMMNFPIFLLFILIVSAVYLTLRFAVRSKIRNNDNPTESRL
ncbi:MAG: UDP-GlcNAc--UDP-phosphate GlcNAc-1-phosphate transferase [Bacteroidales bacterium]|nr:UDP-GlcNAc--UDP-phosphate GlcNAc-1-phosphate transferase [Bacteroidales bacterium]